jgi:hypothetical protein
MPADRPLPPVGLGGNVRHGTSFEEIQVINNHIQAAVAAERRRDLLPEAEVDRQVRRDSLIASAAARPLGVIGTDIMPFG